MNAREFLFYFLGVADATQENFNIPPDQWKMLVRTGREVILGSPRPLFPDPELEELARQNASTQGFPGVEGDI